jgi:hypothetical protein
MLTSFDLLNGLADRFDRRVSDVMAELRWVTFREDRGAGAMSCSAPGRVSMLRATSGVVKPKRDVVRRSMARFHSGLPASPPLLSSSSYVSISSRPSRAQTRPMASRWS